MKSKAAILWETNSKWSVEDIDLDAPRAGKVLVQLAASGLCHSDDHLVTGDMVLDPTLAEKTCVTESMCAA
jgi:Zn-dependent alcohol dehydrogenase